MRKRKRKKRLMDLEKAYDKVNREASGQVLRMYDVGGGMLSGIIVCMLIV